MVPPHSLNLHQKAVSEPRQEVLELTPGTYTVLNATGRVREVGMSTRSRDITLAVMQTTKSRVEIYGVDDVGTLHGGGEAALVRVMSEGATLLVCYRQDDYSEGESPNIVVRKISSYSGPRTLTNIDPKPTEIPGTVRVHIQQRGDLMGAIGDWLGCSDMSLAIEGISISPWDDLTQQDIMYKAVLGPNWESPWHAGGAYCGSRGLDFPINGLRIKLSEAAAARYRLSYMGLFQDGTVVGPVNEGGKCACATYQVMTQIRIMTKRRHL